MEVEKISENFIKPSSPTPSHLKNYEVSLFDQLLPATDIPMILYYSNKDMNLTFETSTLLKQSLSETLTLYYPLAGRINKDTNLSVDCNDEGVCYVEARANITLSEYLKRPDLSSINSLLPRNDKWYEPNLATSYVALIQETIFPCGGVTVGLLVSHRVMDLNSLASFLKCWAAIARNSSEYSNMIIPPSFDGPCIFPQYEAFPRGVSTLSFIEPFFKLGKLGTRRLVFDAMKIANLKAETSLENPTGVEVVSAILLECITANFIESMPNAFMFAVNLRPRAKPMIPENAFGNFLWIAQALCSPEETNRADFEHRFREAISQIDSDFVKDIQNGGFNKLHEMIEEKVKRSRKGGNFVLMTSWCKFGLYEVDFGWGKPTWVTSGGPPSPSSEIPYINSIIFMDAGADNKGIEAWVSMDEDDLILLEKCETILQYASFDPSPLK